MSNFVKQTKMGGCPSLFQCAPSYVLNNLSCTCLPIIIADCPASSTPLDLLDLGSPHFSVWVPHSEAYASWGLTRVLYAVSRTFDILFLMLRHKKPSVWFVLPVIWATCEFKEREPEISTPRYLALVTDSKTWPCRMLSLFTGFLDPFSCTFCHFEGLNPISQLVSHADKRLISF